MMSHDKVLMSSLFYASSRVRHVNQDQIHQHVIHQFKNEAAAAAKKMKEKKQQPAEQIKSLIK